jgi:hypothetical protein
LGSLGYQAEGRRLNLPTFGVIIMRNQPYYPRPCGFFADRSGDVGRRRGKRIRRNPSVPPTAQPCRQATKGLAGRPPAAFGPPPEQSHAAVARNILTGENALAAPTGKGIEKPLLLFQGSVSFANRGSVPEGAAANVQTSRFQTPCDERRS